MEKPLRSNSRWLRGDCFAYAIAILETRKGTPYLLMDPEEGPVHAVVKDPEGRILDAAGEVTLQQLENRYGAPGAFLSETSEKGLGFLGGVTNADLRAARKHLAGNPAFRMV